MRDPTNHRENKVPTDPNVTVTWDRFCPGQGQEEGWKEVSGALSKEKWHIREGYAGNAEVLDMVDI